MFVSSPNISHITCNTFIYDANREAFDVAYTNSIAHSKAPSPRRLVGWLVVLGYNATLTAKVVSWRSMTHM